MDKCTERAKITVAWGGKLLNYCPVHANQIAMLGNAIGAPVQAQMLNPEIAIECENNTPLNEEEKKLAKTFNVKVGK